MVKPTYLYKVIVYKSRGELFLSKVHTFWEGHKILQNLYDTFVLCQVTLEISQNFDFCGLLRIYELYKKVRFGLVLGLLAEQFSVHEFLSSIFSNKVEVFSGKTSKILRNLCFRINSRFSWKASKIWQNLQPSFDIT